MCWISGNAVCRLLVLMIKAVLPILTAGRQRAWCARTVKHSVAHTQDADWCHDTIIYCPSLNTLLFRFYPYLKCIWICEMLPWVIARWQARPLQGVWSGCSTCFPGDTLIHPLTTRTIQRRAVKRFAHEACWTGISYSYFCQGLVSTRTLWWNGYKLQIGLWGSSFDLQLQAVMKIAKAHKVAHWLTRIRIWYLQDVEYCPLLLSSSIGLFG